MKWQIPAAVAAGAVLSTGSTAQQAQKIIPPKTVYWMSASTQSGFGMSGTAPSTGDMMRMAMGGSAGPMKLLLLDMGSKLPPASGAGSADHFVPPASGMGTSVPLRAPRPGTPGTQSDEFERPKGKLLLFWGCGETARPGQPVVIDFAKVAAGEIPPGLFAGERVRIARPPSAASWPTYVYWPNADKANSLKSIPANASLLGPHRVAGNFAPEMQFSLEQDWMQGISMRQAKAPSGAVTLSWNLVPGATAHFAQMLSGKEEGGAATVVFWSSSDVQTFMSGLSDFVAPAEAARLVGRKQLMPPAQTSCAIPKEAVAAGGEAGIVMLTSHGPEQNIVYPPRPKDPKVDWVQEWSVKARFASRTGGLLGMDEMPGMGGAAATASGKPKCKPDAATTAGKEAGGMLGGGLGRAMGGALGGMMGGKKKKPAEDCEP